MSHTRVYYVEDSAELRARICRELDQIEGIQSIGWAARAGEAITRIRLERPDVVILDLHLLEESGMDVLRELRKDDRPPR